MKKVVEKGIFLVPQMNVLSPELLRNPILGPVNLAKIRTVHAQAGDFVKLIKKFKPKIVFADDAFGTDDVVFKQRRSRIYKLVIIKSLFAPSHWFR